MPLGEMKRKWMATRLMLNIVSGPFVAWGLGACDHPNPTSWTFAAGYRGRDQRWGTAVEDDDVVDGHGLSIRFMLWSSARQAQKTAG